MDCKINFTGEHREKVKRNIFSTDLWCVTFYVQLQRKRRSYGWETTK